MRLDLISPETSRGKGWARVSFKDNTTELIIDSVAIIRPRHIEPFLGKHGWQISEIRIPLLIEQVTESNFSFLLSPAIVQYLEVSSNYEFIFFDMNTKRVANVIIRWSGISYRPPKGLTSPIEVIEKPNPEDEPTTKQLPVNTTTWGMPEVVVPITEQESPWPITAEPKDNLETTEKDQQQELPPQLAVVDDVTHPVEPKEVRKIRCRNIKCDAEILDSMKICPFCKFPTYS